MIGALSSARLLGALSSARLKNFYVGKTGCYRYPDPYSLVVLGIEENVFNLLGNLGWVEMLRPMRGFQNFTYEFLSSIEFKKDKLNFDNPDHRVSFRLLNTDYEMSLVPFGVGKSSFIEPVWFIESGESPVLIGFGRVATVLTGSIAWPIHCSAQTGHTIGSWSDRFNRPVRFLKLCFPLLHI
ncbi:hypothetical protein MTR_0242s0050 [Medicago truncatula]|uniref:Uncharacterized protein n=1 Tax=Medicago truncatula TaxID=3880 RepID=A0A072TG03_MEDTR|nr:hypothetical protein MTR_0242s0050 [Medicago truncatula]